MAGNAIYGKPSTTDRIMPATAVPITGTVLTMADTIREAIIACSMK